MRIDVEQLLADTDLPNNKLDKKKEQTTEKIEYVTKYVEEWIRVGCESKRIKALNFVDCMCNAGVYLDGELGTASRVLELFIEAAKDHPATEFNLVFNDIDPDRIRVFSSVCNLIYENRCEDDELANLHLYVSNEDVNKFIAELPLHDALLSTPGQLTLLFVDPYDARTVDGPVLRNYVTQRYCELIFNWFSSDHIRNPNDLAIQSCFEGVEIPEGSDAASWIAEYLAGVSKIYFSYPFRNVKNAEIYQIIFITPSLKGLEKIKDALWNTFSGRDYHRNNTGAVQTSMFDLDEGQEFLKESYGFEVQKLIVREFEAGVYTYEQIESYVLRRSMLGSNHIIKYVIKPLVDKGVMIKSNATSNRQNYKKDTYTLYKETAGE